MKLTPVVAALLSHRAKVIGAALLSAALVGGVTAAIAHTDAGSQSTPTSTEECRVFNTAVSSAMQNHMSIVDRFMSSAEKGMQKAMDNSCLAAIQMLNFNLAGLIPDFNIFGRILDVAIEKFAQYLTSQVCQAVNSVIGDWNNIMGQLKVDWNVNAQIEKWGDGVIAQVPGGSAPLLSGSTPGSGLDLIGTAKLETGTVARNCYETLAGVVCSDGSMPASGSSGGSNGAGGTDYAGNSVNGSQVGAEYERMKAACSTAQNDWSAARVSEYNTSYVERMRTGAVQICKSAQDYYKTYSSYLATSGAVTILPGLTTPTDTSGSPVGTYSLPVRQ